MMCWKFLDWMVTNITKIQSPFPSSIKFWSVIVIPKYLDCAIFTKDLLAYGLAWILVTRD
jgi:hypothetical protein